MSVDPHASPPADPVVTCYRHPDRRAGVSCQRCGRPVCPSCMVQASVGFQCPECVKQGAKNSPVITARSLAARQPYVTYALMALNVAAFLAILHGGGSLMDGGGTFAQDYGLTASGSFPAASGQFGPLVGVANGQWYRLFTNGFVHFGLVHLALNMFVLWIIGSQLERVVGAVRYLALYVTCLAAGSFAVMLASPNNLTAGASGAIFGLMGAAASYQRSRGISLVQSGLGALIVLNLVFSFTISGISVAGHIGGLVGGLVVGWLVFQLEGRVRSEWVAAALCGAITLALVFGGIWAANQFASTGHAVIQLR
jgi:membrane associated rhomboid family serine protease